MMDTGGRQPDAIRVDYAASNLTYYRGQVLRLPENVGSILKE